jgi:UDP-N-acetylmuramoylalanine--D-glutamate ligase
MLTLDHVPTTTRGALFLDALAGRPVTVVGFAREAAPALRRLHAAGAHVRRLDPGKPAANLAGEALVVVTAAAALHSFPVAAARAAGVRVLSDLDVAWCATEADAFALAGGRSATRGGALFTAVLAAHGRLVGSLPEPDGAAPDPDVVLVEPTIDQIAAIQAFRPRVAAVLPGAEPIAPRLLAQQTASDCLVLSADDPHGAAIARAGRAPALWLSATRPVNRGVYVERGRITARLNGSLEDIGPAHGVADADLEPALLATACALWMGLAPRTIGAALARCLDVEIGERPAATGVRFASGSVRSLLLGGARALLGQPAAEGARETETAGTGAR